MIKSCLFFFQNVINLKGISTWAFCGIEQLVFFFVYVSAHIICLLILQNSYRAVAYFVLLMQSVTKQRKRIYRSHSFQKVDDCERLYFNPC